MKSTGSLVSEKNMKFENTMDDRCKEQRDQLYIQIHNYIYCANLWSKVTVSELLRLLVPGSSGSGWSNTVKSKSVPPSNLITTSHKKRVKLNVIKGG